MSDKDDTEKTSKESSGSSGKTQRDIPGDFAYTGSHGVLKRFLEMAAEAARPQYRK